MANYIEKAKSYIAQNDAYKAVLICKEQILKDKLNYDAWFYLGYSLKENSQIDDAIIAYKRALELKPDSSSVLRNLGNIYCNLKNNPKNAIKYYEKFIKLNPENHEAKGALGTLYLKIKDYKKGWEYFEYCKNKELAINEQNINPSSITKNKPLWEGENIKNKILYVYNAGGFGDTIMFARFLPIAAQLCKKLIIKVQPELITLIRENELNAEIYDNQKSIKIDYHLPIICLPHKFNINKDSDIPYGNGYLHANKQKVNEYKNKYFKNNKLKVGLCWEGNTLFNKTRHINFSYFYALLNIPNIEFYSLQTGANITVLIDETGNKIINLGNTFSDFSDTAAAIENLDLVITIDTAIAHLAGSLNKPCWIVLPYAQDWRWGMDISDCPWYKSVKLYKQQTIENWDSVINEIYKKLIKYEK